jgi:hypothetical protein
VFSVSQVEAGGGLGRECWGGSVTVISIHLSVFFSAEWKQEGVREGMLGWECNCY